MAREILIVWAGRQRRDAWEALCEDYRERIGRMVPVRDVPVRPHTELEGEARLAAEAEALERALPDPCWLVALDRRGRQLGSEELARRLREVREAWPHPLAFLIGSDVGLAPALRRRARERWSFGRLTLPHSLARLVLYEQIYRGLALAAGIKYHRPGL